MKYNIWNKWDPLKVVMLGDNWGPEFFQSIKDDSIRSPLQQIADETLEELAYFESVLKDFGCTVIRPVIDRSDRIENYVGEEGEINGGIPRNALQPRDHQVVGGNTLYSTLCDNPGIAKGLQKYGEVKPFYEEQDIPHLLGLNPPYIDEEKYSLLIGADWPSYEYFLENRKNKNKFVDFVWEELRNFSRILGLLPTSANSFLIGKDVYVDFDCGLPQWYLEETIFPNTRINILDAGTTHHDGCFHPIKPGAILSIKDFQNYEQTFPDWDVCYLQGESWEKVRGFLDLKKKNMGAWWLPGAENNPQFADFVNKWLDNWVGYVEESVFDVNVLVLDEHHVCVNNMDNPQLLDFLKKHKMEPVHVPWRHRYFWDGGLHCITLDLYREGVQQDYFPDRKQAIVQKELSNC